MKIMTFNKELWIKAIKDAEKMGLTPNERSKRCYEKNRDLQICVRGCGTDTDGFAVCKKCRIKESRRRSERRIRKKK